MANNKFVIKNGLQTQDIDFVSPNRANTISIDMLDTDTLSVSGNSGQLFSITDSLTGTIFAVNDISGVPSIEVFDTGKIQLAETFGNVLIGTATDNGTDKLQIDGSLLATTVKGNLDWSYIQNKPDPVVTVTLTGDVTGTANATLTDLGNGSISIATTIGANSVALGTDTTGDYVASVTTTSPLSGGAAGSEGTAITLSLEDAYGDTKNPYASKTAKYFLAAPNGVDGVPVFRAIVASDIPTLNQNTTGSAATLTTTRSFTIGSTSRNFDGSANVSWTLADIGAADASHTHSYLPTSGGTMTGDITFGDDQEGIVWSRNTDSASIKFYNTADGDTDSRLEFNISDNTNEDFRFTYTSSGTTTELLRIMPDGGQTGITFRGNTVWHAGNDGAASGLDADTLDGNHASAFALSSHTHSYLPLSGGTLTGNLVMSAASIQMNRVGSATHGISWYSSAYDTWQTYMAQAGQTSVGARSTLTVPTGTLVTSWGLRNYIEDSAGYGWTWESGTGSTDTTPTIVAELRSSDGTMKIAGDFYARSKSFLIDHPTKEGKKLHYGSLEGPEHGVYVRGKLKGNTIELPEYWSKLVDPDSITVQLTPIGKHQNLYVKSVEDNKIIVGGSRSINCYFVVYGERVDIEKLKVETE